MVGPWQRQLLPGAGRQGMLLHQLAHCFLGEGGSRGTEPRGPRPPVPSPLPSLGLGRRAQQAAPGHRHSYKLFGRVYKRANPCSHRTGFVPSPEPSLTINRGWVSSKVCSICCLLLENRNPFRIQENTKKAEIFVNIVMVILIDKIILKKSHNKGKRKVCGVLYQTSPASCRRTSWFVMSAALENMGKP